MAKPSAQPKTATGRATSAHVSDSAPGAILRAYQAATRLAAPIAPLLLWLRARNGKEDPARSNERFGQANLPRPPGPLLWFHAASVGETNAILPLIGALGKTAPDHTMLLTTGTVTSAKLASAQLPKGAIHQFAPLDIPKFVTSFLDHWRPAAAIFAESEIWPNLVQELGRREIPLALVNGRMSERSYRRWQNRPKLSRPLFSRFQIVLAHNEETAQRFRALGAPAVEAVGSLKADAPAPPADPGALARLQDLTQSRPVVLAASIHPGEDDAVIATHGALKRDLPELLTIIAPRHPERGEGLAERARNAGLKAQQRSRGAELNADCEIYVADTIGELGLFYALAPIAFVGGSLVTHGGQNPIEAVKHGCAVIAGPHVTNFADVYSALSKEQAVIAITDADDLAPALAKSLVNEQEREAMVQRASKAVASMAGALDRTVAALLPLLGKDAPRVS